MGLVMFARYGEDSPLDKGYVQTNDQVSTNLPSWYPNCCEYAVSVLFLGLEVHPNVELICADGAVLCDGCVQGSARARRTVCGLSLQWSSQVNDPRKQIWK